MDDLNGKCVNVVLAIEMGSGFSFLEHPVKIIANFHGRPLESDLVKEEDCPVFNTELAWEIEKKELRKIRATNSPLRVEVQCCDDYRQDRVGFILLSARYANIIPYDFRSEIPFKWYKLLGVPPEHKRSRPELFLSLTIRDLALENEAETPYLTDIIMEEIEPQVGETLLVDSKKIPLSYLPNGYIKIGGDECYEKYLLTIIIQGAYNLDVLLPEVLQHSSGRAQYFISFNMFGITIKSKPFCRDLYANIPMNEKIVVRIVSEYETIRQYLTDHCQIIIYFYCGSDQLGLTKLNVQTLLEHITEAKFKEFDYTVCSEQKCYFKYPSEHGIVPTGNDERQPYIEVDTSLKQIESQPVLSEIPRYQSSEVVTEHSYDSRPESQISVQAPENGTSESCEEVIFETKGSLTVLSEIPSYQSVEVVTEHSYDSRPESQISVHAPENGTSESCEEVIFETKASLTKDVQNACGDDEPTCGFTNDDDRKKTEVEEPGSQVVTASGDQNYGHHLELALNEESHTKIEKKVQSAQNLTTRSEAVSESCKSVDTVLKNVPPLISVTGNRKPKADTFIDFNQTFYQQYCLDVILENISLKKALTCSEINIKFKHPKASTENVSTISTESCIGKDILLESTRCKMYFISTKDNFRKMVYMWPPKLVLANDVDDNLTEELDVYTAVFLSKERFECSYSTEFKSIRTYEPLAKISITMYLQEYGVCAIPEQTNYMLMPPILDEFITIQELQALQSWKSQQKAQHTADLKILQKQRLAEMQERWSVQKSQMEEKLYKGIQKCNSLSTELQAAINNVRTKNALKQKEELIPKCEFEGLLENNVSKYIDCSPSQLVSIISKLERENENLKKIIDDKRAEVEQIKKTALTKEQTTSLLQQLRGLEEKFEDAQKAKTYFKDQWKKAVREIHNLKAEDHKQIQERIQSQKIQLSQLSLENFISESTAVQSYDFAHSVYPVSSQSTFGAFKWDNSLPYDCSKDF